MTQNVHTTHTKSLSGPARILFVGEPGILGTLKVGEGGPKEHKALDNEKVVVAQGLYLPKGVEVSFGNKHVVLSYESAA